MPLSRDIFHKNGLKIGKRTLQRGLCHAYPERRGPMAIPDRFLDELISRTDLVDLVSEYVPLNKKGRNYWGLCPFHSEKTPSFSVSADKQIFKCFGCGKGGGAINFVMELDNLPFRDAVAVLAKRVGMEVPEFNHSSGTGERRKKLLEINKQAARAFHRWLYQPEGAQGLHYLQQRGLSKGTLTRFGLGFAPNSWDALISELAKQGYDKRDLLDAGLAVNNKDGRIYDRFRNRVMFPIIDVRGDVIGFGGRVMDDATPKYLNSRVCKSNPLIAKALPESKAVIAPGSLDSMMMIFKEGSGASLPVSIFHISSTGIVTAPYRILAMNSIGSAIPNMIYTCL